GHLWLLSAQQSGSPSQHLGLEVLAVASLAQGVADLAQHTAWTRGVLEGDAVQALSWLVASGLLASGEHDALLVGGSGDAHGLIMHQTVETERVTTLNIVSLLKTSLKK